METPGKKFTDLVEIENPQDTDLTLIRNETGVKKATLQKLSDYIKQKFVGWVFSDLTTKDKTIPGAIKELNSALDKKQDSLKGGTYTGSLNSLKTPGIYWCNFAEVTGSIYSSGYGWVEVSTASTNGSAVQKVYRYKDDVITQIIVRPFVNNQWYQWRVIQTEEIVTS